MEQVSRYLKQAGKLQTGNYYIQEFQTSDPSYFYMQDTKKNGNPAGLVIGGWHKKPTNITVSNQNLWKLVKEKDVPAKFLTKLKSKIGG